MQNIMIQPLKSFMNTRTHKLLDGLEIVGRYFVDIAEFEALRAILKAAYP
jgi:hypothetical protein